MTIFICIDDSNGMAFNRRRQSRDSVVIADVINECGKRKAELFIAPYSETLFLGKTEYFSGKSFLDKAGCDDCCFVEKDDVSGCLGKIDAFVIYKWNRDYPHDVTFDIDLEANGFKLKETEDFAGSSHENITKEIWQKEDK